MEYKLTGLKNGIKVVTVELPYLESATLTVWVGVGSRFETDKEAGISHFMEHMMFKGGAKYDSTEKVSETLDSLGAEYNAGTAHEWTNFYIKARSAQLPTSFDLLSDLVLAARFPQDELEKERGVILEEIAMKNDIPDEKVGDIFTDLIFKGHPLSRDIAGRPETVKAIKKDNLEIYREKHYCGENMVITVAGNVKEDDILSLSEEYFGRLPRKQKEKPLLFKSNQDKPRINLVYKKTEQAHFLLGYLSHDRYSDDRYAESILATILGKGMSSRFFREIRVKRGLAYAIGTSISRFVDTGVFATYAGVNPPKIKDALEVLTDQTNGVVEGRYPIKEEEVKKAKEYIKGKFALALEDTADVNEFFGQRAMFYDSIDTPEDYFAKIDEVTSDDVKRVAKDIFQKDKLNLAVIGPYKNSSEFEKLIL